MCIILKITIDDDIFPKQLRSIKSPPKQLYLDGDINLLKGTIFSIIGSRHGTNDGIMQAKQFAMNLSRQGLIIASGMALGIDSAAHIGTLEAGGKTIAILGDGFNHIFPKENVGLYHDIISKGGLIISEYPPDTPPSSRLFLERNRIVSGLAIGVLVVEAAHRSGTSVTAGLATEQGKKVFVIPHEINKMYGVGTNKLLQKGALLVTSPKDIIENFDFLTYKALPNEDENSSFNNSLIYNEKIPFSYDNSNYNKSTYSCHNNSSDSQKLSFNDASHKKIYTLVKDGVKEIDEIARSSKKSINEVTNILFTLEMQGLIKKVVGGYICT